MGRLRLVLVVAASLTITGGCVQLTGGTGSAPDGPAPTAVASPSRSASAPAASGSPSAGRSASSGDPVVAAAGDIACRPEAETTDDKCVHKAVSDAILADTAIRAVLTLGDNQYEDGSLEQYRSSYDKTWGRFKDITRPVPGNHEYRTPEAAGYFDYFGAAAGDRSKGYYSFDVGSWHFIALNSERDTEPGGKQVEWLKDDLRSHPNACTAAYWHRPRWSSGEKHGDDEDVAPFVEALYEADAELILVGHEHNYERFQPLNPSGRWDADRGVVQIVAGLGGKTQYEVRGRATTVAKNDTSYGYLRMVLHERSADIRFVPVVGSFQDSFTLDCH